MDIYGSSLPDSINPNNFPAKLWRLVNNPANDAIRWDSRGEAIIIDQHRFERQILSPGLITSTSPDTFKTTNFSSFVRQLNLYGFRRADATSKDSQKPAGDSGVCRYFHNPNFKRNRPELVATLIRLTVNNKAKIQAGHKVNCRPPSRYQRFIGGDDGSDMSVKTGNSSLSSPMHLESTQPDCSNKAKAMKAHNGTPFPPQYLMKDRGAALTPPLFAADKGIPLSLNHLCAGVASSSNAVHVQLVHANHGSPNFAPFNPPNSPCHPGCHSPVFHHYHPNLVGSHLTGSELQTCLFSPHSFYQARYPVNMFGDRNQDAQNTEHQEVKKCDINLDTVFQIADDVMLTSPNSCLVRVMTPEKPGPVLEPTSRTCNTKPCDGPASPMQANPLCAGPIIMAVAGNVRLDTYKQQEESVLSVPEQMPEDAIFEVTSNDAKDSEVTGVEVSNISVSMPSESPAATCDPAFEAHAAAPLPFCVDVSAERGARRTRRPLTPFVHSRLFACKM
ncbi:heat shock factor protein 5 [Chelmon rostratus]|uniref:heat shock factor protein 5 n=1 Tax=Chelmon rostratus TaxID=109905 RepID=UPI001BE7C898|nr:heat shock factor protein 5 [Chelmon rostratus]